MADIRKLNWISFLRCSIMKLSPLFSSKDRFSPLPQRAFFCLVSLRDLAARRHCEHPYAACCAAKNSGIHDGELTIHKCFASRNCRLPTFPPYCSRAATARNLV
jgi:hypothetical protein